MAHHRILQHNTPPNDWEHDQEAVWQRKANDAPAVVNLATRPDCTRTSQITTTSQSSFPEPGAAFDRNSFNPQTNTTSVSSIAAQRGHNFGSYEEPISIDGDSSEDSHRQSPPLDIVLEIAGVGHAHIDTGEPRRRPQRLEETHDEYGALCVEHKKAETEATTRAILNNTFGHASSSEPYSLAVYTHDQLCNSNGPERMNEERGAFCAYLNKYPPKGHSCEVCHRPPDYYALSPVPPHQTVAQQGNFITVGYEDGADIEGQPRYNEIRRRTRRKTWMALVVVAVLATIAFGVTVWLLER